MNLAKWWRHYFRTNRQIEAELRQLAAISTEDAKTRACQMLGDTVSFSVLRGEPFRQSAFELPPALHEFFDAFERIEVTDADIWLDRHRIARAERFPSLIRIGHSDLGAIQSEICFRERSDDRIYDITEEDAESELARIESEAWPSVYHWIIYIAESTQVRHP